MNTKFKIYKLTTLELNNLVYKDPIKCKSHYEVPIMYKEQDTGVTTPLFIQLPNLYIKDFNENNDLLFLLTNASYNLIKSFDDKIINDLKIILQTLRKFHANKQIKYEYNSLILENDSSSLGTSASSYILKIKTNSKMNNLKIFDDDNKFVDINIKECIGLNARSIVQVSSVIVQDNQIYLNMKLH